MRVRVLYGMHSDPDSLGSPRIDVRVTLFVELGSNQMNGMSPLGPGARERVPFDQQVIFPDAMSSRSEGLDHTTPSLPSSLTGDWVSQSFLAVRPSLPLHPCRTLAAFPRSGWPNAGNGSMKGNEKSNSMAVANREGAGGAGASLMQNRIISGCAWFLALGLHVFQPFKISGVQIQRLRGSDVYQTWPEWGRFVAFEPLGLGKILDGYRGVRPPIVIAGVICGCGTLPGCREGRYGNPTRLGDIPVGFYLPETAHDSVLTPS